MSLMKWNEFYALYPAILDGTITTAPYDNPDYVEYVKLNNSRVNRWLKQAVLTDETLAVLANTPKQKWILIAEPWCGDAANITPVLHLLAEQSENIDFEIQLRDDSNLIDSYLTNGGKSIPKLIVRDEHDADLFTWGPRPTECQNLMLALKESDLPAQDKKAELQKWYNTDKGLSIQQELVTLLKNVKEKADA